MSWPIYRSAMNVDPLNPPAAPDPIHGFGMDKIHGFRTVSRNDPVVNSWLSNAKYNAHKHIMTVVTEQSEGFVWWGSDIVQIGNEPDINQTYMSPTDYAAYWNLYRDTYDGAFQYFCMAGLASGLGNERAYLVSVWPLLNHKPDMVACHLYDGDSNQSGNEIVDLWNATVVLGQPTAVIASEWNKPNSQIWDMLDMLNGSGGLSGAWNSFFGYSTSMDTSLIGLVDVNGVPTADGASYVSCPYV